VSYFLVTRSIAIVIAALALYLLVKERAYLKSGYTIEINFKGRTTVEHIEFPNWRKAATPLLAMGLIVGLCLFIAFQRQLAFLTLLATFVSAALISNNDVTRYGTTGAPMSWYILALLAGVAVIAVRA
jgi:hypothetical protein